MDAAYKSTRKYPSYTTSELEQFVANGQGNPVMMQEIANRKAGRSVILKVPQIDGGTPIPKVGRL